MTVRDLLATGFLLAGAVFELLSCAWWLRAVVADRQAGVVWHRVFDNNRGEGRWLALVGIGLTAFGAWLAVGGLR